ncbi:MerR family transcriptional regulator [Candidatus Sumerlaeota bacterium]|nr:MerR family transcriptional regulator [Candidatus Sumerlaeota bacterium]
MNSPRLQPQDGMSIGTVARETGINVDTLRMWERRYGAPKAMRLPSGHRRYDPEEIARLQLALRVMRGGRRPRETVAASTESLLRMLGAIENRGEGEIERQVEEAHVQAEQRTALRKWVRSAVDLGESSLMHLFHHDWVELGPLRFLEERVVPFLDRVGIDWLQGKMTVAQEHFASELLSDFLSSRWRRLSEHAPGRPLLHASPPGDLHHLGLIMCAVVTAVAEHRVIYLGPHTPPAQIIETANHHRPAAVCISFSICTERSSASRWTQEIREGVAEEIPVVVGGAGAVEPSGGVLRFTDLHDYHDWVVKLP